MVFENSVPEPYIPSKFIFKNNGIWNPEVTASMFASDRFKVPPLVAHQIPVRLTLFPSPAAVCASDSCLTV